MKQVYIEKDEWYPVYSITEYESAHKVEFTDEEIERIKNAEIEFNACQELISNKIP